MKLTILITIILSIFISCNSNKGTTTSTTEVESSEPEYKFENVTENDSLFTSINKEACFGRCPVYTMKIYNNGTVIYYGKNFVDKEGTYTMKLDTKQLLLFVNKAKEIKYMEMDDTYDNKSVTDLPSIKSSIVINKTRKSIKRRFGYPKEILEFEQLFDDLLISDKWIKVETSKKDKF